jgi:hypothetical protein
MLGLSPPKEIKVRGEDKKNPVFRIMRPADMRNYGEFSVASAYSGKDDVKQGLIESNLGFYADMINSRKLIIERGAIWRILFAWFSLFFEEERAQKILPNPVRFKKGIF